MSFAKNKVALVTGGASGIGLAIATKLLENDARGVGIVDFSQENLLKVEESLKKQYDGRIKFIKADVSEKSELRDAFEKVAKTFGNLDIVVNNAGILDEDNWEKMVSVNLIAVINGTYLAINEYLPKYKSGKETLIVNTSSILGLTTIPSLSVYTASKHGVIGFVKSVAKGEIFKENGTRLLTICPGLIDTNIFAKLDEATFKKVSGEIDTISSTVSPSDYIGESVIKLSNEAQHGSVWVLEDGKEPYEVSFPSHKDLRKK